MNPVPEDPSPEPSTVANRNTFLRIGSSGTISQGCGTAMYTITPRPPSLPQDTAMCGNSTAPLFRSGDAIAAAKTMCDNAANGNWFWPPANDIVGHGNTVWPQSYLSPDKNLLIYEYNTQTNSFDLAAPASRTIRLQLTPAWQYCPSSFTSGSVSFGTKGVTWTSQQCVDQFTNTMAQCKIPLFLKTFDEENLSS
jgi:hypothetical protein